MNVWNNLSESEDQDNFIIDFNSYKINHHQFIMNNDNISIARWVSNYQT